MEHSGSSQSIIGPICIAAVVFPLSMVFCVGNMLFRVMTHDTNAIFTDGYNIISPTRWLLATIVPIIVITWGLKRKSLDRSGAFLSMVVGFILTLSNYSFMAAVLIFFFTSSRATRFRSHLKRKFENDFKEGGQRNWVQVLCNSAMAVELALLYMVDSGCGERPIDFLRDYRASWLSVGVLGAVASCNGDTWSSEIATVVGNSKPFLITSGKTVPKGTNGGVTFLGFLMSGLGGLVVGLAYYVVVLYCVDPSQLQQSPSQWPLVFVGVLGGFLGSFIDSLLGATLQFSGQVKSTGQIVESPGKDVIHVSGVSLLDNHSVNLLSTVIVALLLPKIAMLFWP